MRIEVDSIDVRKKKELYEGKWIRVNFALYLKKHLKNFAQTQVCTVTNILLITIETNLNGL